MEEDPIDISNGTCYYAVNTKAKDDYIPCGNVEIGADWHCCVAGDICLQDSACYHKTFGVTYLAGCTDKRYSAPSCPYKGKYGTQQWTGLQRCDGNGDDGKNIWAACKESGDVPGLKPPARCQCSSDTQVLSDKPKLDNVALLPTSLGGTLSWYDGMRPSITDTTTTVFLSSTSSGLTSRPTSVSSSANSTTTSDGPSSTSSSDSSGYSPPLNTGTGDDTPVTVSTDIPNASTNTGTGPTLSTAAQAGIGVGAGVGALLIGCLVYLAFFLRKRRRAKGHGSGLIDSTSMAGHNLPSADNPSNSLASPFLASSNSNGHGHGQSDGTTAAFPGSSYYKSELAADEPKSAATVAATRLAYSPSAVSIPFSPTAASFSSQQKRYTAYNPLLHGNYAEKSEAGHTPVSPMSPEPQSSPEGEGTRAAYIHELEG